MNKIEKLIQQYCPDGVEYKELGEFCIIKTGRGITKSQSNKDGLYPIISGGKYPMGFYDEYNRDNDIVTISRVGANAGFVSFITTKFYLNDKCFSVVPKDQFNSKFLFYYLKDHESNIVALQSEGGVPTINTSKVSSISIAILPLSIQKEIVSILDKFTSLEAELEAELEARTRQYDYYRNQLLAFEDKDIEWKTLGDIGEFIRGKRFVRTDMIESGFPCIHYGEMYTHYNIFATKSKSFISPESAAKLRVANPGDVVIVAAGETIEDIGKGTAWLGESDVVTHDACFTFKSPLNPKYVSYFLRTKLFHDQIKKHISSGKISAINAKGLAQATIPVPSTEEQERIVNILDQFDALVNDIKIGLPAEIKARRQQYEYYRSKLLTFEKIG